MAPRRVFASERRAVGLPEVHGVDERREHLAHGTRAQLPLALARGAALAQRLAQALAPLAAPHAFEPQALGPLGLGPVQEPLPVEGRARPPRRGLARHRPQQHPVGVRRAAADSGRERRHQRGLDPAREAALPGHPGGQRHLQQRAHQTLRLPRVQHAAEARAVDHPERPLQARVRARQVLVVREGEGAARARHRGGEEGRVGRSEPLQREHQSARVPEPLEGLDRLGRGRFRGRTEDTLREGELLEPQAAPRAVAAADLRREPGDVHARRRGDRLEVVGF